MTRLDSTRLDSTFDLTLASRNQQQQLLFDLTLTERTMPTDSETRKVLSRYPGHLQPRSPLEFLGNAGGLSGSLLWRFESRIGPLVLRAWPQDVSGTQHLSRIHAWLSELGSLPFVPVPLADQQGTTIQQYKRRIWDLCPWMPGQADLNQPPSPSKLQAGFHTLAKVHQTLARQAVRGPSPGLQARLDELQGLLFGGFQELSEAVEHGAAAELVALAQDWLRLSEVLAPRLLRKIQTGVAQVVPLQPCLRDVRPDHFLFSVDRLTGLVDFGAMGVDCVATDLARLLSEWVPKDRRAEALAAYEAVRPLDPSEAGLIVVFESSAALLGGGRWVRWHFVEHRTFEDPRAVADGLNRGLDRLRTLLLKE